MWTLPPLRGPGFTVAVMLLLLLAGAGLVGMVIALGSAPLTLLAAGAVGGLLLLFLPTPHLVAAQLVLSLVIAGVAMYYLKVAQAHWLPYALSLWIWMKLPMDRLAQVRPQVGPSLPTSPLVVLGLLWLLLALVGAVINQTPLITFLVGARSHLFIWSLAFAVAAGVFAPEAQRRAWLALLLAAAIQLPFAAQQHFIQFGSSGSWDAVVGTFGGDPDGGGSSGAMVIYLSIALGLTAALWQRGQLGRWPAAATALAILLAVALAEVKAFFLFAPLMLGLVLLREIRARPGFAIGALLASTVALVSVFAYYQQVYFNDGVRGAGRADSADYLRYIASADSRLDLINRRTGEVSRLGAPLLWATETAREGPARQLFGYGLRASRTGGVLGAGEAARQHAFSLTTSAVTVLLWELGLIGLALFAAILLATARAARRLCRHAAVPAFHRAALEAVPAAMAVLAVSSLYNDAVGNHYTIQTLLAFIVGHVLYWQRAAALADRAVPAAPAAAAASTRGARAPALP